MHNTSLPFFVCFWELLNFLLIFFVYPYTVPRALNNYCQTQKIMKTWKISGMLIVYWPISIKFRIHKQTSKPQTNYRCCLQFSYLAPYWLISCNTITLHKINISGVHGFVSFTVIPNNVNNYLRWRPKHREWQAFGGCGAIVLIQVALSA